MPSAFWTVWSMRATLSSRVSNGLLYVLPSVKTAKNTATLPSDESGGPAHRISNPNRRSRRAVRRGTFWDSRGVVRKKRAFACPIDGDGRILGLGGRMATSDEDEFVTFDRVVD